MGLGRLSIVVDNNPKILLNKKEQNFKKNSIAYKGTLLTLKPAFSKAEKAVPNC